jgi:hypothetical protein
MTARYRSRDLRSQLVGYYKASPLTPVQTLSVPVGLQEEMTDTHGQPTTVNPLDAYQTIVSYPTLSGQRLNSMGVVTRYFDHYPIGYRPGVTDPRTQFPAYSFPELSALAWQILSETNPSAPHVSLPSFIGELKDFVGLIKGSGESVLDLFRGSKKAKQFLTGIGGWKYASFKDSLRRSQWASNVGQGYLSWRWALRPLYNDLRNLLKFTNAVNQRLAWLHHLSQGKVLKRRCSLGTSVVHLSPANVTLHSQGTIIHGTRQVSHYAKAWGTAQWKLVPGSLVPQMGHGPLTKLSAALAGGFTSHEALATAWQLCPWSWFADWFTNLSDTIQATNNTIGCTWGNIALMRTTTSVATFKVNYPLTDSWVTVSNDYYDERGIRKERWPITPVLPFSFAWLPILDYRKWSILAAIASQKRLRFAG